MDMLLGKMFIYSMKSDIKISWKEFFAEAKMNGVLYEFIPIQKGKKKENGILAVKEVRHSIIKVCGKCFGLFVRENGGVLFIPKDKFDEWNPYEKTLVSFPGLEVVDLDVMDSAENRRVIVQALHNEVKENFKDEINKLDGSEDIVGNLKELTLHFIKAAQEKKLKIDATTNMYNRLLTMRDKVTYYERLTNVDLSYIKAHINEAIKHFEKIYKAKQFERYVANW